MPVRSPEEWQRLVDQFKVSGLGQVAFCRQQGICTKRFAHHLARCRDKPTNTQFVVAKPPTTIPSQVQVSYGAVSLQLPLSPLEPTVALIKALS